MEIKVNDRVNVTLSNGDKLSGTVANINHFREPGTEYAVDLDCYDEDVIFVGEDRLEKI